MKKSTNHRRKVQRHRQEIWEKNIDFRQIAIIIVATVSVFVITFLLRTHLEMWFRGFLGMVSLPEQHIISHMREYADFWGSSVITLFTVLASVIVFYYGVLNNKNYGISIRKIIAFSYGAFYIPAVLVVNAFIIVCVVAAFYFMRYVEFYVFSTYSCLLQSLLMWSCIRVTSRSESFRILLKIEAEQYGYCVDKENGKDMQRDMIYHMDHFLNGEETLSEKYELVQKLLMIPFDSTYTDCEEAKYVFLYNNMKLLADHLELHSEETQAAFEVLQISITRLLARISTDNGKGLVVYMSALFHAFLPKTISEKYEFLKVIFKEIEHKKEYVLHNKLMKLLLQSLYFLWFKQQVDFEKEEVCREVEGFIREIRLPEEHQIDVKDAECVESVRIWLSNTSERYNYDALRRIVYMVDTADNIEFIRYLVLIALRGGAHSEKRIQV